MPRWLALFGAVVLLATPEAVRAACSEDEILLRGGWGTARFSVEIADDADERSRGLMFVEEMPRMSGMLFIYERPQNMAFWMRNTLIPLDMLFFDEDGVIGHIHHDAIPGDETSIPSEGRRLAVLEINGGLARQMGITVGSEAQHPAFGDKGVWPCE